MHFQEGFNPIIGPSVYQPSSADRVCEVVLRNTGLQLCDLSMCTQYVFWDKFKVEQIKLPRHFMKVRFIAGKIQHLIQLYHLGMYFTLLQHSFILFI